MIPISKPSIGEKEIKAVTEILRSGNLVQGKKVAELEKKWAKVCGTKYAVAINNGTAALHTALFAIGITPGDEVITTPFTFVASANSILMAGAKPVFVDIDEKTYNIDPNLIEKAITKKTRAILAVNLYGQPADFEEINKIAKKHNLLVVEDAAQSIGAQYKKKMSGNLGDIATFSLYATKNIMCGEGGMITTNNRRFYDRAVLFRNHGQPPGTRYVYDGLGYNYRMTDFAAAFAIEQLKSLFTITKKRQQNAHTFSKALVKKKGIIIPEIAEKRTHVFHQYTIQTSPQIPITRDELQKKLEKAGIGSNIFYPKPLYDFPHFGSFNKIKFPVCEKISKSVLSIPVHPSLSRSEIKYIIETIQNI